MKKHRPLQIMTIALIIALPCIPTTALCGAVGNSGQVHGSGPIGSMKLSPPQLPESLRIHQTKEFEKCLKDKIGNMDEQLKKVVKKIISDGVIGQMTNSIGGLHPLLGIAFNLNSLVGNGLTAEEVTPDSWKQIMANFNSIETGCAEDADRLKSTRDHIKSTRSWLDKINPWGKKVDGKQVHGNPIGGFK